MDKKPAFSTNEVNIEDLVDIRDVKIDTSLPLDERKKSYLEQIKNPHLYRCGDTIVRVSYLSTGRSLADSLKSYLLSKLYELK